MSLAPHRTWNLNHLGAELLFVWTMEVFVSILAEFGHVAL